LAPGERPIARYRLYFLKNEHIEHAVSFECADDHEAIRMVKQHSDGRAMEVWSGKRMVARFPEQPGGPKRHRPFGASLGS
jgi:hypothetical protein